MQRGEAKYRFLGNLWATCLFILWMRKGSIRPDFLEDPVLMFVGRSFAGFSAFQPFLAETAENVVWLSRANTASGDFVDIYGMALDGQP